MPNIYWSVKCHCDHEIYACFSQISIIK